MILTSQTAELIRRRRIKEVEMDVEVKVNRIHKLTNADKKLKAFADIEVNGLLMIKGLQIVDGDNGLFVSMPRQKGKDNIWYEIVRIMTPEAKKRIMQAVLDAFKEENNDLSNNASNEC